MYKCICICECRYEDFEAKENALNSVLAPPAPALSTTPIKAMSAVSVRAACASPFAMASQRIAQAATPQDKRAEQLKLWLAKGTPTKTHATLIR